MRVKNHHCTLSVHDLFFCELPKVKKLRLHVHKSKYQTDEKIHISTIRIACSGSFL